MREKTVYKTSTGQYFGDGDLWERFESGAWTPCCWDEETGKEWVRTEHEDLLLLRPIPQDALPDWVAVEHDAKGVRLTSR